MSQEVQIYTDGACSGNPGPGGWAAVLLTGTHTKEISGFEPDTTNNRMEILAGVKGLESLKSTAVTVKIYSDSSYLVKAINEGWLNNWQKNGWKTSAKEPVKNRDLWERLCELNKKYSPKYIWVKGHADNPHNQRCDELAVAEYKSHQ